MLYCCIKKTRNVSYSSNESLWLVDNGMGPDLWEFSPSQIIFRNLDVLTSSPLKLQGCFFKRISFLYGFIPHLFLNTSTDLHSKICYQEINYCLGLAKSYVFWKLKLCKIHEKVNRYIWPIWTHQICQNIQDILALMHYG